MDSVVIAKMDGTENEHPELEVKGFPTLFFVPAEKGAKPIPFDGERTLKVGACRGQGLTCAHYYAWVHLGAGHMRIKYGG